VQARRARRCGVPGWVADGCAYCYVVDGVTGLALHTLMQGTATTARYTKRYVQVD